MEQGNIIFHIDVNSAFLSWTAVKMLNEGSRIDIREVPSIIGGNRENRHGIVLAKSIPAKKYGIKTAQTVESAISMCPDLLIVPPEHDYYYEQSHKLMKLLKTFTPIIEQVSVDECYMDYSSIAGSYSSPVEAAHIIKDTIKKQFGFTVNIGISDAKVLAKMASDFQKPDRVHTLYRSEIKEKMWPLPISDLFMAGKSSVVTLNKLGIFTIGQLATSPVDIITSHLKSHGKTLHDFANGRDDSSVNPVRDDPKGVGNSITLSTDYTDINEIDKVLLMLSEKVGSRLRNHKQLAKTVAVEIKYSDFTKSSKQMTLERRTDSSTEIYRWAKQLFRENWNNNPVRLLGVRTTNLSEEAEPEQLSIMDMLNQTAEKKVEPSYEKLKKLDKALDAIKNKYGDNTVTRASLMTKEKKDEE